MDERDWLLINEDKRPSTITFGEQHPRAKPLTTSKTDRQSHEQEFQIVILAKAGKKSSGNFSRHHIIIVTVGIIFLPVHQA